MLLIKTPCGALLESTRTITPTHCFEQFVLKLRVIFCGVTLSNGLNVDPIKPVQAIRKTYLIAARGGC